MDIKYKQVEHLIHSIDNDFNEKELFFQSPELSYIISKLRRRGVPKLYREIADSVPINSKQIFFESAIGKQFRGSPKYMYRYIRKNYPDYVCICCYNNVKDRGFDDSTIIVERGSKEYYEYLATSKYVINDTTFPIWFLRDETIYLQTWHGTPLKKLHWDRNDVSEKKLVNCVFYNKSRGWDVLLSPNRYSTEKLSSAFKYDGLILESGYPSNDIFFDDDLREGASKKFKKALTEVEKKKFEGCNKVILYAPTWRDNTHTGNYKFDFEVDIDVNVLNDFAIKNNFIVLIRMHHMSNIPKYLNQEYQNLINVSDYDDVHEILAFTDLLITDYSSIMFDFACSRKPFLNYVPDIKQYSEYRGMYIDMEEVMPYPLCKTVGELFDQIMQIMSCEESTSKNDKYTDFFDRFCHLAKGKSTETVVKWLLAGN